MCILLILSYVSILKQKYVVYIAEVDTSTYWSRRDRENQSLIVLTHKIDEAKVWY